jgi:hypothetical protein
LWTKFYKFKHVLILKFLKINVYIDVFLQGFAFAYGISLLCTFISALFVSFIQKKRLSQELLTIYSVLLPITIIIMGAGIYISNPFIIGVAFAIASSWVGYLVKLK